MSAIDEAIKGSLNRRTHLDYLMLADRADVLNNKLYVMGGGWDRIAPPHFPFPMVIGLALGVRVSYAEAEDKHTVRVVLERADNGESLIEIDGELQTGRPPGLAGKDLLVPMAFNLPFQFQEAMDLVIVASVDGQEQRRQEITVVAPK